MSEESVIEKLGKFSQYYAPAEEWIILFCRPCDLEKALTYDEMVEGCQDPADIKNVVHQCIQHVCGDEENGWKKSEW